MLGSLLTTKLYFPPVRPALVPRPRLMENLQASLQTPLTIISAPAGSGKTTLLAEWRAGTGAQVPLAWISLDAGDNDPSRFFHYLIASLDPIQPGLQAEMLPLLQIPELLKHEVILTALINALDRVTGDFLLALDDYHVIENSSIQAGLAFLLEHQPAHMHIILLTRADPPLPLSRLRARGYLVEIRADQLGFTLEEAAQFLNKVMGLKLTGHQVDALAKRTEGWIAGLQLAALSMQGQEDVSRFISDFTGSNHYIVDYLGEEVLNSLPEPLQEFLLETSLLDRFNGSLCDAVTGLEGGSEILERLEHANLFVTALDKDRCWYRYHHLFTDLLRSRLLHAQPEVIPQLHRRASAWFAANGLSDEAIDHALAAGDYPNAARLFLKDSLEIFYTRSVTTLERWLTGFPDSFVQADPRLCIARAHLLWLAGRKAAITPWIAWAEEALAGQIAANPGTASDPEHLTLLGEAYAFRSLLAQPDADRAAELAQKAVDLVPKNTRNRAFALRALYQAFVLMGETDKVVEAAYETIALARTLDYPASFASATYALCMNLRFKGKFQEAERMAKEALKAAENRGQAGLFYYGFPYITLAEIYQEWNELDEMKACLDKGLALIWQGGQSTYILNGMLNLAQYYLASADFPKVMETLAVIERECKDIRPEDVKEEVLNFKLRCQAAQGNLNGLADWVDKLDRRIDPKMDAGRFSRLCTAASFLLKLDRVGEAQQILNDLEANVPSAGITSLWNSVHILQALAWDKEKQTDRALAALEKALVMAQPQGQLRPFLDEGREILPLVRLAHQRGIFPEFTTRLISALTAKQSTAPLPAEKPALLSKRELELLGMIAAGSSNKDIAARLVISLATVKRHAANIYNKLDVKNRTEAVARARELNLF